MLMERLYNYMFGPVQNSDPNHFCTEFEINDYPQQARWKVTHKGSLDSIIEFTACAITTKGTFVAPGRNPPPGEKKLFLYIEGPSMQAVSLARTEIKRILEEATSAFPGEKESYGKYTVV